jgi:hypothetical protein
MRHKRFRQWVEKATRSRVTHNRAFCHRLLPRRKLALAARWRQAGNIAAAEATQSNVLYEKTV